MAKGWHDVDFSFPFRFGWQCGKCGASTAADVHAVVDAVARPDLVRKIIDGEIPYQECDSCGTREVGGLPLLIYSDQAYPQLFFFYPEHTTPENDEAVKKAYVDRLLDQLGPVTAEEAEQGGVVTLPYEAAGVILAPYAGDEPESTVRKGQWTFKPDDGEPPADVRQIIDELRLLTRVPLGRSVADKPRASQVVRLADRGLALLGERATAYELAVAADDEYYRTCLLRTSRESGLRMVGSLHQRAAYAMARASRLADAVLCLEQGRVRALHEELAPERELLRRVAETDPDAVAEYERAADTVRALESQNRELSRVMSTSDTERTTAAAEHALGQQMAAARAAMEEAIDHIRRLPGMDSFMARVTLDDIMRAVEPGEPLCYLAAAAPGAVCLVVRHESDPGPALAAMWCQLTETRAQAAATTVMTGTTRIRSIVDELGASLVAPLVAALGNPSGVVIVACGALAHLPLHAATLTATGEPLISALSVSHVPSARMLLAARQSAVPRQPILVAAADSGPDGAILAESEVDLITRLFDRFGAGRAVPGETTTLLDALPGGTYVHLACHGEYRPDDPLSSGLDVGGGRVTLAELLDRRPRPLANARLVTLSACETAVVDATLPDEAVGLPAGILLAGAAAVVCTQWRARDTAAVLLMVDFYRRMLAAGDKPAEALRQAQLWLRGATRSALLGLDWLPTEIRERLSSAPERPFGHPYLWASFTVVGV